MGSIVTSKSIMEDFLHLRDKLQRRVKLETYFHIFGMAVLTVVGFTIALDLWKKNLIERTLVITVAYLYFLIFSSSFLYLKHQSLKRVEANKLKIWIQCEVIDIIAITAFIGIGTPKLLPPPFDFWTGTLLLMFVYWLPLISYKISQISRVDSFLAFVEMFSCSNVVGQSTVNKQT